MTATFHGGSLHGRSLSLDHEPFLLSFQKPLLLFGHAWEVYQRDVIEFGQIVADAVTPTRSNIFVFRGMHMNQARAA